VLGTVEGVYHAKSRKENIPLHQSRQSCCKERSCQKREAYEKEEELLMAKTSKEVKKLGAKTQTGNMQHKDCPCTQG